MFTQVTDPVGQGLVPNLAHPGGNLTGFTSFEFSIGTKWLEALKQTAPHVTRVALVFNPHSAPFADLFLRPVEAAAPSFSVTPIAAVVCATDDLDPIGTTWLCSRSAAVTGVLLAKIRSGAMANSSAAWLRNSFSPPPAQRYSIQRLGLLTHPSSRKPCSNAATRDCASGSLATRPISTPMRRTRSACCARAPTGHAATPASAAINSRLFIRSPRRRGRAALAEFRCAGTSRS